MNGILTYFKSFMGFLLIVFLLTACNNDVDLDSSDGSGCITPVEAEALAPSLAQFFGKVDASEFFPYPGYHHDYYNNHDLYYNEYITINSVDDFSNYYKGLLPVPDVDFSKYTLIVGWVVSVQFCFGAA